MLFFFKQKTAYEMRISDWSSDVCSSDLQPSKDVPSTRLDQIPLAHLSDRHTFACPAILVGGIFALANRSEVQLRLIASLINRQYAISANIARSEEQTSELPSLLRISYAVFCLKKQTVTIKPVLHHTYT